MPLTQNQALDYCRSDDLIGLGMEADALRRELHPEGVVTYTLNRKILCFSAPEILAMAAKNGFSLQDTIVRLRDAGLESIPGDGTGILGDNVSRSLARQSSTECSMEDWLNVHRTAHHLGMRTTAAMTFGRGETFEERVQQLEEIRRLQGETGGFAAFFLSSFRPGNAVFQAQNVQNTQNAQDSNKYEEPTAVEYLKMLAVARLYLDTIENMECSSAAQGLKVLQLSLRFGGNDAGPAMAEEESVKATIALNPATEEQLRHAIRGAGFKPVQRDALYTTCFLN
jgi:cyclic dehypoxanthinyl futalosine synthase